MLLACCYNTYMKQKGFTLIELLVVISIISLLSSVVMVNITATRNKSKDTSAKAQMKSIQNESGLYYLANGSYDGMWASGTLPSTMWSNVILIEDNNLSRGVGATGNYFYAAILMKNGNYLCLDGYNLKEVPAASWVLPTGNFVCP